MVTNTLATTLFFTFILRHIMVKSYSSLLLFSAMFGMIVLSCNRSGVAEQKSDMIDATCDACQYNIVQIQTDDITSCQEVYDRLNAYGFNVVDVEPLFPANERFKERHAAYGLDLWFNVTTGESRGMTKSAPWHDSIPGIRTVEFPQKTVRHGVPFNDPYLGNQWYLNNSATFFFQKVGCDINVFDAWNIETGSPEVIVNINDAGFDITHPDIAAHNWVNEAEYYGLRNVDDDGNGFVDDKYGYNFVSDNSNIVVDDHGTHVAGAISAINGNGLGICGIAGGDGSPESGVRLMYCQVISEGYSADASKAMVYAADNGAVISQNSWGLLEHTAFPAFLKQAIDYFCDNAGLDEKGVQTGPMAGGVVIFSAGNENSDVNAVASYDRVISVGALGPGYEKASYSNYGEWVDIMAPGGDYEVSSLNSSQILSTVKDGYGYMQGTSMACPMVSGVAALIVSHFGGKGFTADMLKERLLGTANPECLEYNKAFKGKLGVGMVDALAALRDSGTVAPEPVTDIQFESLDDTLTVEWTIPSDDDSGKPCAFILFLSDTSTGGLGLEQLKEQAIACDTVKIYANKVGSTMSFTYSNLKINKTYYARIYSYDIDGNVSELSPEFSYFLAVDNLPPAIRLMSGEAERVIRKHESTLFEFEVSDPENGPVTCDLECSVESGITFSYSEGVASIAVEGSKIEPSEFQMTLSATDKYGDYATETVKVTVLENSVPVLTRQPDNILCDGIGQTVTLVLDEIFTDSDGEDLKYSVSGIASAYCSYYVKDGKLSITSKKYGNQTIVITATDANGGKAQCTLQYVCRNGNETLEIYPVPTADYLYIRSGGTVQSSVMLYNVLGSKVLEQKYISEPFVPAKIDLRELSAGSYTFVSVVNGVEIKKTVVKK